MIRFDNLPPEVMQAMCTPMHNILPPSNQSSGSLYLGSFSAIQDASLLRQHNITHLVQVLDVPWLPVSEKDGFECYKIPIQDEGSVDLKPYLEAVCSWIARALGQGRSVLVHCQQGISRSPAIIIAYLMRAHHMSYSNAYSFVLRKRACIKPNSGFVRALQEWEAALGSSARPGMTRRFTS
ncbi:hypothetical protein CVT25_005453 [Psilocybe cyanescens]|uniref:protein-tyrosine-phosphatase n=1 Tax=Psilocybe cyanescens TaxID=93625 RepID=A0A409VQI6_PSICY|nr:hypothetical protein CVT25_005453 [Psilocybe cyanescens]